MCTHYYYYYYYYHTRGERTVPDLCRSVFHEFFFQFRTMSVAAVGITADSPVTADTQAVSHVH